MWKFLCIAVLVLALCVPTKADVLPDKPLPQPETHTSLIVRPFKSTAAVIRDAAMFRDKEASALLVIQTGFLISDGITTRKNILMGQTEIDPFARALLGPRPTWNRMIPIGATVALGSYYLGAKMHRSDNKFVRHIWWIPQAVVLTGNVYGTFHNLNVE